MRTTRRHGIVRVLSQHAFLIIICLAALYPVWFIASTALRSNAAYQLDPTGFPSHPTLGSLRNMSGGVERGAEVVEAHAPSLAES